MRVTQSGLVASLAGLMGVGLSQEFLWAQMDVDAEDSLDCTGKDTVNVEDWDISNWDVTWNLTQTYVKDGAYIFPYMGSPHTYRTTLCGPIEDTTCSGSPWCLERVNRTNTEQCIEGIAEWKDETDSSDESYSIEYFLFLSREDADSEANTEGVTVKVTDRSPDEKGLNCPDNEATVFFMVRCHVDPETYYLSIYEDYDNCLWNVSVASQGGCVTITEHGSHGDDDDGGNGKKELSAGWILIIILLLMSFVYLTVGFLSNACLHGRSGKEALPHYLFWSNFGTYVAAGCAVTLNTLRCRSAGSRDYATVY